MLRLAMIFAFVPQLKKTFRDVKLGPLCLRIKQVKCPNTPLEETVRETL